MWATDGRRMSHDLLLRCGCGGLATVRDAGEPQLLREPDLLLRVHRECTSGLAIALVPQQRSRPSWRARLPPALLGAAPPQAPRPPARRAPQSRVRAPICWGSVAPRSWCWPSASCGHRRRGCLRPPPPALGPSTHSHRTGLDSRSGATSGGSTRSTRIQHGWPAMSGRCHIPSGWRTSLNGLASLAS